MTDARQPSPAPTRRRPEAPSPPATAPAAETAAKAPTASRLLKEQGILTEAEFTAEKAKILAAI